MDNSISILNTKSIKRLFNNNNDKWIISIDINIEIEIKLYKLYCCDYFYYYSNDLKDFYNIFNAKTNDNLINKIQNLIEKNNFDIKEGNICKFCLITGLVKNINIELQKTNINENNKFNVLLEQIKIKDDILSNEIINLKREIELKNQENKELKNIIKNIFNINEGILTRNNEIDENPQKNKKENVENKIQTLDGKIITIDKKNEIIISKDKIITIDEQIRNNDNMERIENNKKLITINKNENLIIKKQEKNFIIAKINKQNENQNEIILNCNQDLNKSQIQKCDIFINNNKIKEKIDFPFKLKKRKGNQIITLNYKEFIQNMSQMFYDCQTLTALNFDNFISNQINDISQMFFNCSSLIKINFTNFNTTNITNMQYLFSNCISLTELDLSSFNTSKVIYMNGMFNNCQSLKNIIFNFNTSNVRDMSYMFSDCYSLTQLDLSNFDTSKVQDMFKMFFKCMSLLKLNIESFIVHKNTDINEMFKRINENCNIIGSINIIEIDCSESKINID